MSEEATFIFRQFCVCVVGSCFIVFVFLPGRSNLIFLGRQLVPSGVHLSSSHPPGTRRAPPAFSSLYLPLPSFLTNYGNETKE